MDGKNRAIRRWASVAALGWLALTWTTLAEATDVLAVGDDGMPMADVAVWATAWDTKKTPREKLRTIEIGQKARAFERLVSVVEVGQKVSFPNYDVVRHHVYSFSEAKRFDLQLYSKGPSAEVLFDQEGLVVLGCNIHDKMLAYVRVVPTSVYAVTGTAGLAILDLPEGNWVIHAWHPILGEKVVGKEAKSKGGSTRVNLLMSKS